MQIHSMVLTALAALTITLPGCAGLRTHDEKGPAKLPNLGVDKNAVTVSGISSGAFMAVQLGVAYSDRIQGVSSVAGGIYSCAQGDSSLATGLCMKTPDKIVVASYVNTAKENFQKGLIADPKNLAHQKVFILNGTEDNVIKPVAGKKLQEFYQAFNAKPEVNFSLKMGHGFPTSAGKIACEKTQIPWTNKCNYEGAEKIFTAMYGPQKSPTAGTDKKMLSGELIQFDQTDFGSKDAKMLDSGSVYIPKDCKGGENKCRLHIAFHGCVQDPTLVQEQFTVDANYNAWADANKIVVLYPATRIALGNPQGCWDWFGYTNGDYATRKAPQMASIIKMVDTLTASPQ